MFLSLAVKKRIEQLCDERNITINKMCTICGITQSTLANVAQVIPELANIPLVVLKVFPYIVTLIALIIFSKSSQAPKAAGEIFDAGKR